jgi:hypothetical protein
VLAFEEGADGLLASSSSVGQATDAEERMVVGGLLTEPGVRFVLEVA